MKKMLENDRFIDKAPDWLKAHYVSFMQGTKTLLKRSGTLNYLDEKAKLSRGYHYVRSLLAIHDLPDMVGLDVPWWTYSAIDYLSKWLEHRENIQVFEWGSGASTLWLAKRATKVISVEHDPKWYHLLEPFLANANVEFILKEPDRLLMDEKYGSAKIKEANFKSYVLAIEEHPIKYDLIVIDGRARTACLLACLPYLKDDGLIVLDNSERARYQNALIQSNLEIKRFTGRVPGSPFKGETAILSKR